MRSIHPFAKTFLAPLTPYRAVIKVCWKNPAHSIQRGRAVCRDDRSSLSAIVCISAPSPYITALLTVCQVERHLRHRQGVTASMSEER